MKKKKLPTPAKKKEATKRKSSQAMSKNKITSKKAKLTRQPEGETSTLKIVLAENLKFRAIIKRHTVELDKKDRELEIEAALERVRARTMAMQHSGELSDVVYVLYKQMQQLGFDYGACTITLMNAETGDTDWWMAGFSELEYPDFYQVSYFNHPGYNAVLEAWKRKEKFAAIEIDGQSKKAYDKIMFTKTGFSKLPEHVKEMMAAFKSVIYSMAYMRYGALSFGPTAISDTQKHILQKFAKVFEQTYTRFLDLQKAEAQAREAQIEAALEKIRSRSLAMHHSGELRDVIAVFFEKLIELGTLLGTVGIGLYDQKSKDISCWVGNAIQDPQLVVAPFDEAIMMEENFISQSWKAMTEKIEMVNVVYSREQKDRYFKPVRPQ